MKKTKFKCCGCKVTVKRPSDKLIKKDEQKYCSEKCKAQDEKQV